MRLFRQKEEDWKDKLDDESKFVLADVLNSTKKHRYAYTNADDVKIAQLWTALIEMRKELSETKEMLGMLQQPWRAIISIGDEAKRKTVENLVKEIIKPADETSKEATQKLVDSLMQL